MKNRGRSVRRVLPCEHPDRLEDDLQIEPWRPMAQIFQVIAHALAHLLDRFRLAPQSIDLRKTGNAVSHLVADHVATDQLAVLLVMSDRMRARTHHAHFSFEYVQ